MCFTFTFRFWGCRDLVWVSPMRGLGRNWIEMLSESVTLSEGQRIASTPQPLYQEQGTYG